MRAYMALPDGEGPFPGIVVIHEIFGLNDNIREITHRFTREGYTALAVDLFSTGNRVICMLRIFHGMLVRPLNNGIVAELQAALNFLKGSPKVDPGRVGVIGFCMGGSYALQLASVADPLSGSGQALRAASVFYGMNPRPLEAVAGLPGRGELPGKGFHRKCSASARTSAGKAQHSARHQDLPGSPTFILQRHRAGLSPGGSRRRLEAHADVLRYSLEGRSNRNGLKIQSYHSICSFWLCSIRLRMVG